MKSQQTFMVEVTFYSNARKMVPEAGYRPHFVMELDEEQEYLGIEIYDIEVDALDLTGYAMCSFCYEQEGVGYSKIQPNRPFMVMEGASIVGRGTVVSFNL
ncbi:hypothetical protein ACP0AK_03275 [Listeria ivanovii]|uniref:Uncharacterized protein n=1 Tax=Listeria ivanovii (strain ATCC BAA-678 / PAM 55) TaxID=881621 RepID=G2ZEM2_LISIP|nr:hypothetical protein [Listeria ivanovii]AHI55598.1 hypothetical protein AX25_05655 [Listeria ivanovii WSLC3009]AIS65052.1 hypothetical protein JL52_05555 [Listeria ivanovii subsp. ivanovii]MBC1758227.1 hypothetical protein [Listeria ivanovii]MBK3913104.1 hypothetical protein [Listeria ivanovii subsp. ivanovii]MBK3920779.1 hypothetical protein [Listeria ivanovii subsp. ivanovii]